MCRSSNFHIIRKLIEHTSKQILQKMKFTCTVFLNLLFVGRSVILQENFRNQRGQVFSEKPKKCLFFLLKLLDKWLP